MGRSIVRPTSGGNRRLGIALLALAAVLGLAAPASAFCGFYVAGATSDLYANATMVVLMRDGTRTVLSMQNNYQGPPSEFALVIPVPVVLTQDQVKILPHEVFDHVDRLGSPRLVEYWEQDPCLVVSTNGGTLGVGATAEGGASGTDTGVTVEAQFAVGEYQIVILSADNSSGLSTWLTDNNYNIPSGASDAFAPYVAAGSKFFVAKVDPTKVTFTDGQAALSPLRFYYDTPDFSLPVRLGLLNSQGVQDLIVNILAPDRYEVANYPNVTVPTNLRVQDGVRDAFGSFYEAMFQDTVTKNPGSVITEYAWSASSCDPCPVDPLSQDDLATLGADVTQGLGSTPNPGYVDYTLTRLHYRYGPESLGEDLVFRTATPIVGGRGIPDASGALDATVQTQTAGYSVNTFQGRYVILHPWTEATTCAAPARGIWGEMSAATGVTNTALTGSAPAPSMNLATLLWSGSSATGGTAGAVSTGGATSAAGAVATGGATSAAGAAGRAASGGSAGSGAHASGGGCNVSAGARDPGRWGMLAALGLLFSLGRSRRARQRPSRP
jgi:MYXO-CTERM domain-containing protein